MKIKTYKKVIISIIFVAGLLIVIYGIFAFVLISSDHAYYSASGKNLGEIDYESVIFNAKKAGYMVDGPYYGNVKARDSHGLHPQNIKELDEKFGDKYRIIWVYFYYTKDSGIEVTLPKKQDSGTKIHFFNESTYNLTSDNTAPILINPGEEVKSKFKLTNLPSDEWIIKQLKLMFGFDEQKAHYYLTQLKDSINHNQEPEILIKENPDLLTIYNNFKETSNNSTLSLSLGEGSCKETFYKENEKIGYMYYIIPNVRIIHQDKGHEFMIKIDRLGGVNLQIKLDVRDKIPEEEYRNIFKDMFNNLELQSKKVDEFEFRYQPSVW